MKRTESKSQKRGRRRFRPWRKQNPRRNLPTFQRCKTPTSRRGRSGSKRSKTSTISTISTISRTGRTRRTSRTSRGSGPRARTASGRKRRGRKRCGLLREGGVLQMWRRLRSLAATLKVITRAPTGPPSASGRRSTPQSRRLQRPWLRVPLTAAGRTSLTDCRRRRVHWRMAKSSKNQTAPLMVRTRVLSRRNVAPWSPPTSKTLGGKPRAHRLCPQWSRLKRFPAKAPLWPRPDCLQPRPIWD
mmetsp:Transcript_79795/g.222114  ORF Transcript_79795/g.222114 Transcript_79795/m.222114 type:complete len:244 (-) Transcript_79795:1196-1927(-)